MLGSFLIILTKLQYEYTRRNMYQYVKMKLALAMNLVYFLAWMCLLPSNASFSIKSRIISKKIVQALPIVFGLLIGGENQPSHAAYNPVDVTSKSENRNQYTIYTKGMSSLVSGEFDKAISLFDEAMSIDGSNADVHIARGIAYEKVGKWNEAIADYREANAIYKRNNIFSGDDPVAISNIANAETGLGKWNDALRDFTYSASLKPDYLAPQIGRAFALYQLDKKDEALVYFRSLVSKYPSFADGNAALAVILYEKGNAMDEVKDAWEEALEADSRYVDIEWVRDIRRWPPKLVDALIEFKKHPLS
jgi:tetratricopeptide (TPR) repeat protein